MWPEEVLGANDRVDKVLEREVRPVWSVPVAHQVVSSGGRLPHQVNHGVIESRFQILERKVLEYGTLLDMGRTFIIAQCRPKSGFGDR